MRVYAPVSQLLDALRCTINSYYGYSSTRIFIRLCAIRIHYLNPLDVTYLSRVYHCVVVVVVVIVIEYTNVHVDRIAYVERRDGYVYSLCSRPAIFVTSLGTR